MEDFGFIITRHVNSEKTNEYWNLAIKLLNYFYPNKKIIIIDDNSNLLFVKQLHNFKNIEIIFSEFQGRGEILPYYYFYKLNPFKHAVILHDSVFFHQRISFEKFTKYDVLPFWNFSPDNENFLNSIRLISSLKNKELLSKHLNYKNTEFPIREISKKYNEWNGCFGVQSFISHSFLSYLVDKYDLFQLLHFVKCRADRCCLERIFGILFAISWMKDSPKKI